MNAFAAADKVLFSDPNLSVPLTWQAGGEGATVAVRGIVSAPDIMQDVGQTAIFSDSLFVTLRFAEIANPAAGDRVMYDDDWYVVDGEPVRDAHRLTWRVTLVPEARG